MSQTSSSPSTSTINKRPQFHRTYDVQPYYRTYKATWFSLLTHTSESRNCLELCIVCLELAYDIKNEVRGVGMKGIIKEIAISIAG